MKRLSFLILALVAVSVTAYSQDTRKKLGQVKRDPATTQRAAKADAQLVNKKAVTDSTKTKTVVTNKQQPVPRLKRKSKFFK